MLDPKEQAKGGFRARAAREQERLDVLVGLRRDAEAEGITAAPPAPPATAEGEAEGAPAVAPPGTVGTTSAYPPPGPHAPSGERQAGRRR